MRMERGIEQYGDRQPESDELHREHAVNAKLPNTMI